MPAVLILFLLVAVFAGARNAFIGLAVGVFIGLICLGWALSLHS